MAGGSAPAGENAVLADVAVVSAPDAYCVLDCLRQDPLGKEAAIIGEVVEEHSGQVLMRSPVGGQRVVQMLSGEQLPRIC